MQSRRRLFHFVPLESTIILRYDGKKRSGGARMQIDAPPKPEKTYVTVLASIDQTGLMEPREIISEVSHRQGGMLAQGPGPRTGDHLLCD